MFIIVFTDAETVSTLPLCVPSSVLVAYVSLADLTWISKSFLNVTLWEDTAESEVEIVLSAFLRPSISVTITAAVTPESLAIQSAISLSVSKDSGAPLTTKAIALSTVYFTEPTSSASPFKVSTAFLRGEISSFLTLLISALV